MYDTVPESFEDSVNLNQQCYRYSLKYRYVYFIHHTRSTYYPRRAHVRVCFPRYEKATRTSTGTYNEGGSSVRPSAPSEIGTLSPFTPYHIIVEASNHTGTRYSYL
jgi:hypothetical protein